LRRALSIEIVFADDNTRLEAEPVSPAPRLTSEMLLATTPLRVAEPSLELVNGGPFTLFCFDRYKKYG
jgi:hypothetical protein